jgi:anti-sigma factor RsiW
MLLDGELAAGDEAIVFEHLAACKECRTYISILTQARVAMRKEMSEVPRDLDEKVLSLMKERPTAVVQPFWRSRIPVPIPLLAAALLCLVALTVFALIDKSKSEEPQVMTSNLVQAERIEYLYVLPAVEVVGSETLTTSNGSIQR